MKISILIPCYNEELTIERCLLSCINQTRKADQILVVDDSSVDGTFNLLKKFETEGLAQIIKTPKNTGTKSHAQEFGMPFVTGDIFITTDGDTMLHRDFLKIIEQEMQDPEVTAVAGYVKSLKYNWITACRAIDYAVSQNIDKLAQDYLNFIFVVPGAAGAFRTNVFREKVKFSHDTVAEDLDFTYAFHKLGCKIKFARNAICYTQDPASLEAYIKQMERWFGGGWQCFVKHFGAPTNPGMALELSFIYVEGLIYSFLMFLLPIINLQLTILLLAMYCLAATILAVFASIKEKRFDMIMCLPGYLFLKYVNAWIFIEEFFKEVILRKKDLSWYKPKRMIIK